MSGRSWTRRRASGVFRRASIARSNSTSATASSTPDECRQLCGKIDADSFPSPLYDKDRYEDVRTSYSCNLDVKDPLVASVDARIARLLGIETSWGEPLQGQRYEVGQRFKEHADFFYVDEPYWAQYEPHGGQRTWTAMIYLNHPERGGATGFKYLDLALEPLIGRMLVWNNMAIDGSPNPWTTARRAAGRGGEQIYRHEMVSRAGLRVTPSVP